MKFSIIVATDMNWGIGKDNNLPWPHLSSDMKHFSKVTKGDGKNAVIMGRKTWDSLPDKYKPLPGRLNIVLSRNQYCELPGDVMLSGSLERALEIAKENNCNEVFVIGGGNIYSQAIEDVGCEKIYLTRVLHEFEADTFFPSIDERFKITNESEVAEEKDLKFQFVEYERA